MLLSEARLSQLSPDSRCPLPQCTTLQAQPVVDKHETTTHLPTQAPAWDQATDTFLRRHIGPANDADITTMLATVGTYKSLNEFADAVVPASIRAPPADIGAPASESEALASIAAIAAMNSGVKSFIGQGYYGNITPGVVKRNLLEDPRWYTSYTPYQAEISQGRLEMLLNFQTMVADLTGMDVCNSSLLDEGTAASEALTMAMGIAPGKRRRWFVAEDVHPQTLDVVTTRANGLGVELVVGNPSQVDWHADEHRDYAAVLVQTPNTYGSLDLAGSETAGPAGWQALADAVHGSGALVVAATDVLACTAVAPPGDWGADIVVGSAQRFGVPMGYGGPHAGFLATKHAHMRRMPGRLIGVSVDSAGDRALRMAMQTREQHIRRDRATSNICTAQALLANTAAAYGIYHGPDGLRNIAGVVHDRVAVLAAALQGAGHTVPAAGSYFDTIRVGIAPALGSAQDAAARAVKAGYNIRVVDDATVCIALDETATADDVAKLADALNDNSAGLAGASPSAMADSWARASPFMTHAVFHAHRSETQMLRYLTSLANKDLSLASAMIPLGSCTMKLNATSQMEPVLWPQFANVHPFVPPEQAAGYAKLIGQLSAKLATLTGFDAMSVQPNSGAAGEYAGLLAIRGYLESQGQGHRNVCLIPASAHGTNPASAVMAGMKVVVVQNNAAKGTIDAVDLAAKLEQHGPNVGALMVTYPSTYGMYEDGIKDIIAAVHKVGGQVYMDGANMNAQAGLTSPGSIGADVCHLNLHKTFAIPHGGGGPGVGAIGVKSHLAPFLPGHAVVPTGGDASTAANPSRELRSSGAVASAPFGSGMILPITWMYLQLLGGSGVKTASQMAMLNANYLAARVRSHFDVLYSNDAGLVAHEFIIDIRPFKSAGIKEEDVAKRLMDFGFHAPTMSWPVPGTLMIEPTESEDKAELDRFADALIHIRAEIQDVQDGKVAYVDSPLAHAPHTIAAVTSTQWDRKYTREEGAFPLPWVRTHKFWPAVGRIDNVAGDRNPVCSCPPVEDYM